MVYLPSGTAQTQPLGRFAPRWLVTRASVQSLVGRSESDKALENATGKGKNRAVGVSTRANRRGRDSNPRYGFIPYDGLANRWFQPLTHLSSESDKHHRASRPASVRRVQPVFAILTLSSADRIVKQARFSLEILTAG